MVNTVKFSEFGNVDLANTSNELVGVSAPTGGVNLKAQFPLHWDISTRPITPFPGTLGYNSSLSQYEFWNGLTWVQLAAGGSGTVNVGAQNEVAFYPNNGTAVSGILTQNNAGLFTNISGVPSMVVATGTGSPVRNTNPVLIDPTLGQAIATSIEFTSTDGIIGTTTNNNASVGSVGEELQSVISFGSAISLTNNVPTNLTSIILHAGDWDVWGNVTFTSSGSMTSYSCWLSTTSATIPDASLFFKHTVASGSLSSGGGIAPSRRFSLAANTTVYLSAVSSFPIGTVNICGGIYARVRR